MTDQLSPAPTAQVEFQRELVAAGLLFETGVPGVFGHGATFELLRHLLAARIRAETAALGAEHMHFPPVLPRQLVERSGYLDSFPQLAGVVFAFDGGEPEAAEQHNLAAAGQDWSKHQRMTDLMLVPAACYPAYPVIAARGPLAAGGAFLDLGGSWVFRHEPSADPARRQIFHQHEIVRIGAPNVVEAWRQEWADRGLALVHALGLEATVEDANDPFFGHGGRMLAASQREQHLKLELLVPIAGEQPTAVASFNLHREHFAEAAGIKFADGSPVHTSCTGFGQERIVLALLRAHGLDPSTWPSAVRGELRL
jgi:seryl-tRNA synthetase